MENCRLGKLPPELRNMVYKSALHLPAPVEFEYSCIIREHGLCWKWQWTPSRGSKAVLTTAKALTRVCKQLHRETSGLIFALNDLKLSVLNEPRKAWRVMGTTLLRDFSCLLGPAATASTRSVTIEVATPIIIYQGFSTQPYYLPRLAKKLQTQSGELGWDISLDMQVAVDIEDRGSEWSFRAKRFEVRVPVNGTATELDKVLRDFDQETENALLPDCVGHVRSFIRRCIIGLGEAIG